MIKVLINGISGKMGMELYNQVITNSNFKLVGGISRKRLKNLSCPVYTSIYFVREKPDVIIDFSNPNSTLNALSYACKYKIPVVIATTGFSENDITIIKKISFKIPIFLSSNMSYMVTVLTEVACNLSNKFKDADIEILEYHHNKKKDAPSGTALSLANSINASLKNTMKFEYNRHSLNKTRQKNEIGIHSIRGGLEVRQA